MVQSINIAALQDRTGRAIERQASAAIAELPAKLRDSARRGQNKVLVSEFIGFKHLGRLSFDGELAHLPAHLLTVWCCLQQERLILRLIGSPLNYPVKFDGGLASNGKRYWMVATWPGSESLQPHDSLVRELQDLHDQATRRIVDKIVKKIPVRISRAADKGLYWKTVYQFEGLVEPNSLLPFNGEIANLTGVEALIWNYLTNSELNPRLFWVSRPTAFVPGIGKITADDFNGKTYRIAARWGNCEE